MARPDWVSTLRGWLLPAPRRLSRQEIRVLQRRIEREERVRFPRRTRVEFTPRMRHPLDYASWRGTGTWFTIRLFQGHPPALQALPLEHELREIAGVLRGKSVSQAHRDAMRKETRTLASLPYRTRHGKPYRRSLSLLRRFQSGGFRPASRKGGLLEWLRGVGRT